MGASSRSRKVVPLFLCGRRGALARLRRLAGALSGVALLSLALACGNAASKNRATNMAADPTESRAENTANDASEGDTLRVAYEADAAVFANPERGFYIYTNLDRLDSDIGSRRAEGLTLVWGRINMEAFRDAPALPPAFLEAVSNGFDIARDQGMKVIVRGAYGSKGPGGDYTSYTDPPKEHIKAHIEELAPVFAAHADVIALFEAGFVGPWGEWHTTDIARDYDQGRDMLFHLLDHTPAERLVLVRYPYLKQRIFADGGGFAQVDAGNAYSASRVARVGHHNDCFLASETDFGTYERGTQTRAEEVDYLAGETLYTAFGGETCRPFELNDCGRAIAELETLHGSYLNSGYHPEVLQKWARQGCLDEVERRLGARLVLLRSRIAAQSRSGQRLKIEIDLENRGFAPLYNPRDAAIVLEHETAGDILSLPLDIDPRQWKPGPVHTIAADLALPEDMAPGRYTAYLHLPDPSPRLRDDPRYAYRVANTGVWDEARGYNRLAGGLSVE